MQWKQNKTIFFALIFSLFIIGSTPTAHAQSNNLGFIKENIWYSKDPFYAGDKIKVYTLVWNPENTSFSGTLNFFDDSILLGKKTFKLSSQSSQVISIDWEATPGTHKIYAKIEDAKLITANGNTTEIDLEQGETSKSTRVAQKNVPLPELPNLEQNFKNVLNPDKYVTPVKDLAEGLTDKLPDFIASPVQSLVDFSESFRESARKATQIQQEKVEDQIGIIQVAKVGEAKTEKKDPALLKPFKYLELFFITLFAVVFENKWLFYSTSILFTLLIVRYLWSRFV